MTITAFPGRVRRAALIVLLGGAFFALMPICSFATGTVTLAWDPGPGTNTIAKYNIYFGSASHTYTNTTSAGTATTLTLSNLVDGTTYYFAATAVDTSDLESDYSTEVSTIIPTPGNQPPTLNPLADVTLNENAGLQTVPLSGITSGATNEVLTLTVTASSSNPSLIPTPAVSYTNPNTTGSIAFTPVASAYGSATITVTVNDSAASNNVVSSSFMVTVIQTGSRPPPCTYALSLSPTGFTANAASGTFSVSTGSNCVWNLVAPSWVALDSTNGTGAYAGTFTVEANTSLSRTGLVSLIGGATDISCTLTQQALATGAVALVTPLDNATVQASPQQFSWSQSDLAATNYYLWIACDGSNYLAQWTEGATNWTVPTNLPAGNYTWAVEPWTPSGAGPWSTNSSFTIQAAVPGTIVLLSPAGVVAGSAIQQTRMIAASLLELLSPDGILPVKGTQRYTWKNDPAATRYELYVEKDGSLFLYLWFASADSVVDSATGNFAVDVTEGGSGTYQWWVRGYSPDGYGPWSQGVSFRVP